MMKLWARMSRRERGLAVAIVVLVVGGIVYSIVSSALEHLDRQMADIDRLEQQLVNYSRHLERRTPVDAAFARIAEQHSSQWTGEEINDRLTSEIYRLAREDPGTPGNPGVGREIVPIPLIPPGELEPNPDGYRVYTVDFRTDNAPVSDLTAFLRRLEESPQALRIEVLDIRRAPDLIGAAQAAIRVNRTVVDGVEEAVALEPDFDDGPADLLPGLLASVTDTAPNGSFEVFEADGGFEGWLADGCRLMPATVFVTDGQISARVEPVVVGASFVQPLTLAGGATYEMTLDVMTTAPLEVRIEDSASGDVYEGAFQVPPDNRLRSYTVQFTVAGQGPRPLNAPVFRFDEADGMAHVDRVRLRRIHGAK